MSLALLGGGFDYSGAAQDEFDDWYDTEHVPERLRIKGFINAVRWIGAANPKISLAIYDVNGRQVASLGVASREPGIHRASLPLDRLAHGIYFVRMRVGHDSYVRRLPVLRIAR